MNYGNKEFERLFKDNYPHMYRMAFSMVENADDAKDAVQHVYAQIWRNKPRVADDSIRGYLLAILLGILYCLVEVLGWEVILVKDHPALVIELLSLLVGFTNTDCLADKRHCVHRLSNSLDRRCSHAKCLEIVWFSPSQTMRNDCLISLTP